MTTTMALPTESVVVDQQLATTNDPGNAAHIVMVPPGEDDQTPQAYVLRATVEGFPVTALCGYTWVPGKDPRSLAVCSPCKEMYEADPFANDPEARGELPDA